MDRVRSGIFIMPFHPPGKPLSQCHDEDMELVIRADELGIDEFWIGEHHTMVYENIAMPEIFIGAALRDTSDIRLGPAPVCLQQHHPALVASRLSFLDHLSHGRLNLCFGPGSVPTDLEILGVEPQDSAAMVAESMDMILTLWMTDPPYDIDGRFWKIRMERTIDPEVGLGVIHKPFQRPHPPVSMPISSMNSETARQAGRRGFQPFGHSLIPSNTLANIWTTYERAAMEAGHTPDRSDYKIARAIFLADSTEEAVKRARSNTVAANFEYIGTLLKRGGRGMGMFKRDSDMHDADCNLDYLMGEQIIAGNVDAVLERLQALRAEVGDFGTLVMMSYDWDDKDSWLRSLELFATELMPALNRAVTSEQVV